jgi:hypothetical protein
MSLSGAEAETHAEGEVREVTFFFGAYRSHLPAARKFLSVRNPMFSLKRICAGSK